MTDNRTWQEVEWCLRLDFAASYLKYASMTGLERQFAVNWIGRDDLAVWAAERINELLEKCNVLAARTSISTNATDKSAPALMALAENRGRLGLLEVRSRLSDEN